MSEFNKVEPLYLGGTTVRIDGVYIALDQVDRIGPNSVLLLEDEAREIRDWLDNALLSVKQQPLSAEQRASVERERVLREALKYMRNDLAGCLSAFPEGMREAISNTNFNILTLRVTEADDALSKAHG